MKNCSRHVRRLTEFRAKLLEGDDCEDALEKVTSSLMGQTVLRTLDETLEFLVAPSIMRFQSVVENARDLAFSLTDLGIYPEFSELLMDIVNDALMEQWTGRESLDIWLREQEITRTATGVVDAQFREKDFKVLVNYIRSTQCYSELPAFCEGYSGWMSGSGPLDKLSLNTVYVPTDMSNPRYAAKLADASLQLLDVFEKSPRISATSVRLNEFWNYIEALPPVNMPKGRNL